MTLPDFAERRRALTELDRNLIVEAAAGTGKTAVIAGRVVMLLADGRPPSSIAAVTFSVPAAGQIADRIRRLVLELCSGGDVPPELAPALPDGLDNTQRTALEAAVGCLDAITTTTIHGFCRALGRAHAIQAGVDPGAVVMDADQADAMFGRVFAAWLERRLSVDPEDDDPVAVLALDDPDAAARTLRDLADVRRRHPAARAPASAPELRPDVAFRQAVDDLARWHAANPREPRTAEIVGELTALAAFYEGSLPPGDRPTFGRLWQLARPPRSWIMAGDGQHLSEYGRDERDWRRVADGDDAVMLAASAAERHEACREAYAGLVGFIGGELLARLSGCVDELLHEYRREKQAAAAVDFDDLQENAARLVRDHEGARRAIADRYRHLLVDEFQDTDPTQAEVILGIAGMREADRALAGGSRPGSLFLVGDPKQAIYRFRGADIATYLSARDEIARADPDAVIVLTASFRSDPSILDHVNRCFEGPLDRRPGQPGYVPLKPTLGPRPDGRAPVIQLAVATRAKDDPEAQRDAEAAAVAELCAKMVGNVPVRRPGGAMSPARPGDFALLSMTHADLWRYERALAAVDLPVAAQAGKALMRRQETQDFLALARTLADRRDGLALGAFLRGPLVGMSETELLSMAHALPAGPGGQFAALADADPAAVGDPVLRRVLLDLRDLRAAATRLTPMALMATAFERFRVGAALALRTREREGKARANLDALLIRARAYGVRGLAAFAADLDAAWERNERLPEGRCDERDVAVTIATVHAAKGLEWPVVIPVNGATRRTRWDPFVHRRSDGTLHWSGKGVVSPSYATASEEEREAQNLEAERLWYVACTRARDFLVLPDLPHADKRAWSRVVDLGQRSLGGMEGEFSSRPARTQRGEDNAQTAEAFADEAARVAAASRPIAWRTPAAGDPDRAFTSERAPVEPAADVANARETVGAGRLRGILMHKLIEEVLTGELEEAHREAADRAAVLLRQLAPAGTVSRGDLPDPLECAGTALRALSLEAIAHLRRTLVAELPVYAVNGPEDLMAGRADAVAVEGDRIVAVVDWKSDVAPDATARRAHAGQMADYLSATGAARGAIVYASLDEVEWVEREPRRRSSP